jgi:membrane fusion protein (multidrug efflux system)
MTKHFIIAASVVTALMFFVGCAPKAKPAEKALPVRVSPVKPQLIASTLKLSGTVDAKRRATVIAPAEGNIGSLAVAEGRRVLQGQVLCYLATTEYQNMLGQAEAEHQRLSALQQRAPVEEKETLAEQVRRAEERVAAARKLYQPVPVVSPIGGTVIAILIEAGDNVLAKQPLMDIADLSFLIVRTAVSADYLSKMRKGQPAFVTLQSEDNPLKSCLIGKITPSVRIESRTADIEINLPHGVAALPGEAAEVELIAEQHDRALAAPSDVVMTRPDGSKYVFIVSGGRAKIVPITLGIETNEMAEVLSGLRAGDSLVVWGHENLKDGAAVKLPEPASGETKKTGGK